MVVLTPVMVRFTCVMVRFTCIMVRLTRVMVRLTQVMVRFTRVMGVRTNYFQRPRVKSGNSMGALPFAIDISDSGPGALHAAAS